MSELTLNLKKVIDAPISDVFDAWLDAETLAKFMMPMPGMPQPKTEADGREGGGFTILMAVGDQEIPHKGKYLEVNRPHKLVFTWESPFSPDDSTVTIQLKALNEQSTEIDFTHVKFINEEARDNHEKGWGVIVDTLAELLCEKIAQ